MHDSEDLDATINVGFIDHCKAIVGAGDFVCNTYRESKILVHRRLISAI